jgi:hypothetical protein
MIIKNEMSLDNTPQKSDFRYALETGLAAARANLIPGTILWLFLLALVVSYYTIDPIHFALERVAEFKLEYGYLYALIMTGTFGALLPFLIQRIMPSTRKEALWIHLPFLFLFWAYKGVEIDTLYRLQAWAFGDSKALHIVIVKVFVDQFIYNTFWAAPTIIIAYYWKDHNYSFKDGFSLEAGYRWKNLFPVLLSCWAVWIPTVTILYCLPLALQLPVQNVVLSIWMLMFMFIVKKPQPIKFD